MTHAEDILAYLWSLLPDGATNGQIARQLEIRSHQTVYMTTQDLARRGRSAANAAIGVEILRFRGAGCLGRAGCGLGESFAV